MDTVERYSQSRCTTMMRDKGLIEVGTMMMVGDHGGNRDGTTSVEKHFVGRSDRTLSRMLVTYITSAGDNKRK